MKFFSLTLLAALLGAAVTALSTDKQLVITFPQDTPDSALKEAKETLRAAVSIDTRLAF